MIDGHPVGGYTGRYEVICRACGDDPCLTYDEVPPDLQKLRGPSESLASGLAALHEHIGLLDEGQCEAVTNRLLATACWPVRLAPMREDDEVTLVGVWTREERRRDPRVCWR
jgi:hypothetical protein